MAPQTVDDDAFERHAKRSVHFFSFRAPQRLRQALQRLQPGSRVVNVGCGDGQLVWSLIETGALLAGVVVVGTDRSPTRVCRFTQLTGMPAILTDGADLEGVVDRSVDLCISTMVMEHVPDEAGYTRALARIVRPGGWLYLTTALRNCGAWYFRKSPDGRRFLDPMHVLEYESVEPVRRALETVGFEVEQLALDRLVFPVLHPLARASDAVARIAYMQRLFLRAQWCWLKRVVLLIPRSCKVALVLRRSAATSQ